MVKDFSKIISDAQNKHSERTAALQAKEDTAAQEQNARYEAATSFLDTQIRPLLELAAEQFAAQGIGLTIEDNWRGQIGRPMRYHLIAQAERQNFRVTQGSAVTPKSHKAFFQHTGSEFRAGLGRSEHESIPHNTQVWPVEEAEQAMDEVLGQMLDTYFKSVEQNRHL
ncbi:hypothetical protein [Mesorhizobium sp. M7A.F.Ca.MR.148.00.0.0]|uniref:hypothetical protein n=1 Tax=Mesorhizobium sp. M7A.F.Ca.MR.148.00.0.0 TaxID=2496775 RepID=UPI000FCBF4A7|nr:hypothetical protein [Mesorhizobium sp. M7A.F.Ca.MR.148.00.0.0]RUV32937.1 hypothetical protein EOB49_32600 [Mesorhizobium sp. M7A.F.Ca.MR.148.00.0.0]